MALTVEDATGLAGADSYASLAEFNAFLLENAIATTADDATKEAWLREATRYHDGAYDYPSAVLRATQALRLPLAQDVVTADGREWSGIPAKLKTAVCVLAAEARNGSLTVNQAAQRKTKSKIDVIESEFEFDPADRRRVFQEADDLVQQLGGWKRNNVLAVGRS